MNNSLGDFQTFKDEIGFDQMLNSLDHITKQTDRLTNMLLIAVGLIAFIGGVILAQTVA